MQQTRRSRGRHADPGALTFLRIGLVPLWLFFISSIQVNAQQVIPDSSRKAKPDTTIAPVIKPATDTLPKTKTPGDTLIFPADSTSKPATGTVPGKSTQTFDPLVKPATPVDTTKKTTPATDSTARPAAKPDSLAPKPQPGNTVPAQQAAQPADTSRAAQPADTAAAAQNSPELGPDAKSIKGKVVDEKGSGLPGVSVLVKGTQIQAITEPDGTFQMKVPAQAAILVYSFIGFSTKELPVGNQTQFNVQLLPESKALKEVVVVGYGAQSKRDLASSTSRVAATEYKSAVINTVDQAIQGRATGVQVTETSGEPGAASVVRIRGNNSLSGNNEPLYVIDGFPMPPYREAGANFSGA